jgi:hypothetical protein
MGPPAPLCAPRQKAVRDHPAHWLGMPAGWCHQADVRPMSGEGWPRRTRPKVRAGTRAGDPGETGAGQGQRASLARGEDEARLRLAAAHRRAADPCSSRRPR